MRSSLLARAASSSGAKLSGAAGVGNETGAGHRRQDDQHHGELAAFRARIGERHGSGRRTGRRRSSATTASRWAHSFRAFARDGEPVKVDGDKRAPAGFYQDRPQLRLRRVARPDYLRIVQARSASTTRLARLQHHHHAREGRLEGAWREHVARSGIQARACWSTIRPTRKARAGSCIFIHRWLPGETGTSGCVALPRTAARGLAGLRANGRGAGDAAAPGARPVQRAACRRTSN